jgi:anti-anti-sigma factor
MEKNSGIVLADLKNVTFMDSAGLNALFMALKVVRANGGRLFICSVNEQMQMLFDLEGVLKVVLGGKKAHSG